MIEKIKYLRKNMSNRLQVNSFINAVHIYKEYEVDMVKSNRKNHFLLFPKVINRFLPVHRHYNCRKSEKTTQIW